MMLDVDRLFDMVSMTRSFGTRTAFGCHSWQRVATKSFRMARFDDYDGFDDSLFCHCSGFDVQCSENLES